MTVPNLMAVALEVTEVEVEVAVALARVLLRGRPLAELVRRLG